MSDDDPNFSTNWDPEAWMPERPLTAAIDRLYFDPSHLPWLKEAAARWSRPARPGLKARPPSSFAWLRTDISRQGDRLDILFLWQVAGRVSR